MNKYHTLIAALLIAMLCGCSKSGSDPIKSEDDCGADHLVSTVIYNSNFFSLPSEIYWGLSGTTRSYTYNWTYGHICTKKNPKVDFTLTLDVPNNTLPNHFSFDAATSTCFGVQSQHAALTPNGGQDSYQSNESEIGMNQCFGGLDSATIYPYVIISFTTLGSSAADSIYLTEHVNFVKSTIYYNQPK